MLNLTYTSSELMCINAARLLRDGDVNARSQPANDL
jgi:hypothetical protein